MIRDLFLVTVHWLRLTFRAPPPLPTPLRLLLGLTPQGRRTSFAATTGLAGAAFC